MGKTLSLKDLNQDVVEIDIDLGHGKTLHVAVNVNAVNAELEDAFRKRMEQERYVDSFAYFLSEAIVDWDVVDDKGRKVKPTYEVMRRLGINVLRRIFDEIQFVFGMGDEREVLKNSAGGSSLAGR